MDSIFSMPDPRDFDYLIVGAGLSGSVAAHLLLKKYPHRKILLIDQRDHIGGNCYDYIETQTGIRVNKYGAHLFTLIMKGCGILSNRLRLGFVGIIVSMLIL